MDALALFDLSDLSPHPSVHCFFDCGHIVRDADPDAAHAAMERHYDVAHPRDIRQALGFLGVRITATPAP